MNHRQSLPVAPILTARQLGASATERHTDARPAMTTASDGCTTRCRRATRRPTACCGWSTGPAPPAGICAADWPKWPKSFDLSDSELLVVWLCSGGGRIQVELAAAIGISPAQMSGMVERLRLAGPGGHAPAGDGPPPAGLANDRRPAKELFVWHSRESTSNELAAVRRQRRALSRPTTQQRRPNAADERLRRRPLKQKADRCRCR